MISFSKLGNYGRLGNQLFQYAFLRLTAKRLMTKFHCPSWDGEGIFLLDDADVRIEKPTGVSKSFNAGIATGFFPEHFLIEDGTDIEGYFQSERFYPDHQEIRSWYRFKPGIVNHVTQKYDISIIHNSLSLSLRIDSDYGDTREYWPLYPLSYYQRAIEALGHTGPIVVFADNPQLARRFFAPMANRNLTFVEGLDGPQQLYLMTQCGGNVITNSTFAWWGAWLNQRPGRVVVAPSHWCRPGVPNPPADILAADWRRVRGTVPVWDHFQTWRVRHPIATVKRAMARAGQ